MDEKTLKAFTVLAEELNFTRAAERLNVAQPVMSQWIRRLEEECGATLLKRTTRSVALTPVGRAVLPHAQKAVEEMRMVAIGTGLDGEGVVGAVSLGYAGASSRPWLPQIMRRVRQEAPGIDLSLRSMVYAVTGPGLVASGDLDLTFSRRPLRHPTLSEQIFEYEKIMVGMPSDHRLASRKQVSVADLRDEPWVTFPSDRGSSIRSMGLKLAAKAGFEPSIVQEAPDSYTILGLVAAGVGLTLTISSVAHVTTPGMVLRPLAGPPQWMVATVVGSHRMSRAAQVVWGIIGSVSSPSVHPDGIVWD